MRKLLFRIFTVIDKLLRIIIAIQMGTLVAVVGIQVFARFLLNHPFAWPDEISRFLLIWSSLLAAVYALASGDHIGMEYVLSKLKSGGRRTLLVLNHIAIITFLMIVLKEGWHTTRFMHLSKATVSGIPMSVPFIALPFSAFLMILVELWMVILIAFPSLQTQVKTYNEP